MIQRLVHLEKLCLDAWLAMLPFAAVLRPSSLSACPRSVFSPCLGLDTCAEIGWTLSELASESAGNERGTQLKVLYGL